MSTNSIGNPGSRTFRVALSAERKYCSDAVRAILSTILFLRLFGSLSPSTGESLGVTYPAATNGESEGAVLERAKDIGRKLRDTSTKSLEVQIQFFDRQVKKTAWFAKTHNICWETWKISLSVSNSAPSAFVSTGSAGSLTEASLRKEASQELQRVLMEVVSAADNYKEHIPPITTTDMAPFPYEISIS